MRQLRQIPSILLEAHKPLRRDGGSSRWNQKKQSYNGTLHWRVTPGDRVLLPRGSETPESQPIRLWKVWTPDLISEDPKLETIPCSRIIAAHRLMLFVVIFNFPAINMMQGDPGLAGW